MKFSPRSVELLFAQADSVTYDAIVEMNVKRIVADLIEIARETSGNILELCYEHFSYDQKALDIVTNMLEGV